MKVPFTREHGAYGMAITSFVIGSAIGGNVTLYSVLSLLSIIFLIMAKFPLSILLQGRDIDKGTRMQFILWSLLFLQTGFLLSLPLLKLFTVKLLVFTGLSGILHLLLYFLFIVCRKDRTIFAEVLGISTICLSGILGFFSSGGGVIKDAVFIWFLPLLYYTASIFKVRSLIMKEGKEFFKRINLLYPFFCGIMISGFVFMNFVQFSVLLCLVPLVENIIVNFKKERIDIRRTGWIEVTKSAVFGLILIFTLR